MYQNRVPSNRDERPPQMSQFALRVTILGGVAFAMFAVIFFRLWYLEVLSGDVYLQRANDNQVRQVEIRAPRGDIVDRNGEVLVGSRTSLSLEVRTDEMPPPGKKRTAIFEAIADTTKLSVKRIRKEIDKQTESGSFVTPVTLLRDVSYALAAHIQERQSEFPGVSVEEVYVRNYPQGTLGAHLFGFVREINAEQLKEPIYGDLEPGDLIGQAGIESSYDHVLRGTDGHTNIQVNAAGEPTGRTLGVVDPVAGNDLKLTLDTDLQAVGEQALSTWGPGLPGAFVVMDVDTGEILAMGSRPTFDPSVYTQVNISQREFDQINNEEFGSPALNRAMQSPYPTGSTFKLVTALAALQSQTLTLDETIDDNGSITIGDIVFRNAGDAVNGVIGLRTALQVSSDVFFYTLGARMNERDTDGPLQRWAQLLGLGAPTGIDVPGEFAGLIPTPEWRNELYAQAQDPDSPCGKEICFEEGETDRPWSVGDNVNLSVGQGDLQATPLQMAIAYATLANGGNVVRPHVGLEVVDRSGRVVQEINPAPRRTIEIDPEFQAAIMDGLHAAAMEPGGTSSGVFGGFPIEIAGKTGTAERPPHGDQSWYVAVAPYGDPEIVVAVTIEGGGFGADAAAPATRSILESYFDVRPGQVDEVESTGAILE